MESLPSMTSFQSALLNDDPESEEELLSVVSHLVVCAVEDPGDSGPLVCLPCGSEQRTWGHGPAHPC